MGTARLALPALAYKPNQESSWQKRIHSSLAK
jgi:hypothetical protein